MVEVQPLHLGRKMLGARMHCEWWRWKGSFWHVHHASNESLSKVGLETVLSAKSRVRRNAKWEKCGEEKVVDWAFKSWASLVYEQEWTL